MNHEIKQKRAEFSRAKRRLELRGEEALKVIRLNNWLTKHDPNWRYNDLTTLLTKINIDETS